MINSCEYRRLFKHFRALLFKNFKLVAGRAAANSSKKKRKIALPQNSKAGRKKSCKSRLKMNLTTSESPSRSIYWVTQCMTHNWYEFRREPRLKVPISNQISDITMHLHVLSQTLTQNDEFVVTKAWNVLAFESAWRCATSSSPPRLLRSRKKWKHWSRRVRGAPLFFHPTFWIWEKKVKRRKKINKKSESAMSEKKEEKKVGMVRKLEELRTCWWFGFLVLGF